MPLPARDVDVTEASVACRILTAAGHEVTFATERSGTVPAADPRLLTGVLFGQLGAAQEPKLFYRQLAGSKEFRSTIGWGDMDPAAFDGLILPLGHAPGMRQYLSARVLQDKVAQFWDLGRPVGAICHGRLGLAPPPDPVTGRNIPAARHTPRLPH